MYVGYLHGQTALRPEPSGGKVVWFEVGASSESAWDLGEDWLGEGVPGDF